MFRSKRSLIPFVVALHVVDIVACASEHAVNVRVSPHKAVVTVGEPVLITATVTNEGSRPVTLIYHNAPTLMRRPPSVVELRFGTESGQLLSWSDGLRKIGKRAPKVIPPGASVMTELVMLFNRRSGFFTEDPGTYRISGRVVIVASPYIEILTTPITIEVRQPPRTERRTWLWLDAQREHYGRLIQVPWMAKLPDEFVTNCREFCATSDSVYVEYLALGLSRWYAEGPGRNRTEAARFAEIARTRASSERVRSLASKALRGKAEVEPPAKTPERPVEPAVQQEVEAIFQGFIAAADAGDIDRCLELTAEDYRVWNREKQREELQEDIDKIVEPRRRGIPADLSARVLSVAWSGKDVMIMAQVSFRLGSERPEDQTVRCRVRKYAGQWLLQDWTRQLNE